METTKYQAFPLDETCWRIEENGVRVFLIKGIEKALLIDTGFGTGNIREFVETMTDLPIMLVNTHADGDHIGGNHFFSEVYMHPSEYDRFYEKKKSAMKMRPLWEKDIIDLGNRKLEVVLIPGHTPGSIALLDRENRILFSGDSVSASTIYMFGAGRNLPAYMDSLEKLLSLRSDFDTIYPSHGSIPIDRSILSELLLGANSLFEGKLEGKTPENNVPAMLYDISCSKFLY